MDENRGSVDSHVVRYRRDIDGLRAISVLSVVAFHIQRTWLPGGFLGVDVFFVISGYLITGIIWREAQAREFSIARFYERRIRRIMPALLVLLAVATAASTAILLPLDLVGHAKAVFATIAFVANIYFWRDTNYFARTAEEKPLLHMWSLGVEEQFYIVFPLLIVLLVRLSRRGAPWVVLALAVGSFLLNLWMIRLGNVFPAFYLLPTRAWELGAGAFLALLPTDGARRDRLATPGGWIGLALLVFGIVAKAKAEQAIGSTTAVIVGATLILWAGGAGRAGTGRGVSRLLGTRPFVAFGLISYSLYLWHWPIIVLSKYWLVRDLTVPEALAAFALMVTCAWGSWRFVERPFRSKTMTVRRVLAITGGGAVVVAGFAGVILATHGFPSRLNAEAASINAAVDSNYRCPVARVMRLGVNRGCPLVLPSGRAADADVLLVGNSHAQMYAPVMTDILARHGLTGMLVMANTCLPSVKVNVLASCEPIVANYLKEVANLPRAKLVVLAFNWQPEQGGFVDGHGQPIAIDRNTALIAALDDTIARLRAMGKQVMLIGPLAAPGEDIASITSRELAFGHRLTLPPNRTREDFLRDYGPAIDHFAARPDIVFARVDEEQCRSGVCDYIRDGHSLFSDGNHLAQAALPRFTPAIEAGFVRAEARTAGTPPPR